jgi:hypothetical protein
MKLYNVGEEAAGLVCICESAGDVKAWKTALDDVLDAAPAVAEGPAGAAEPDAAEYAAAKAAALMAGSKADAEAEAAKAAAAAAAAAAEKEARDAARTTLISIRYLENSIGPISVLGATTVAELETKVIEWITDDETLGMEAPQAGFLRLAVAGVPVPGETRVMDLPTGADQPLEAMVTEPAPAEAAAAADGEAGGEAAAEE